MFKQLRNIIIGKPRDVEDRTIFHKLSLVAFLAWVGLGSDGISSSCYGPEEVMRHLLAYPSLAILVALACTLTIFVISTSYTQIIRLFPHGGGGYLVSSKLLSPRIGVVAGSALLIDYIMTIAVSIVSGTDALFSFLPLPWQTYKLVFALCGVLVLIVLNLRGVRESVLTLLPIFVIFLLTHAYVIIYAFSYHATDLPLVAGRTMSDFHAATLNLGFAGTLILLMKAYSMGAGTYTGIEAVSNGIPILREPKVETAIRTMRYMTISLSVMVLGLLISYALFRVQPEAGKTLNAVLLDRIAGAWGRLGYPFIILTLISEATLLFVAAQTGFLDGPRVLANMAVDHWVPSKFGSLSDRLVTQNGVFLMGISAAIVMLLAKGSIHILIILYSINVFIGFSLSQLGMVRHWWQERVHGNGWKRRIAINGFGFIMTVSVLCTIIFVKFNSGGWITLALTGACVLAAYGIHRHYDYTSNLLSRLDDLVLSAITAIKPTTTKTIDEQLPSDGPNCDPQAKTAVILVNGFSGLGLHTIYNVLKMFEGTFKNFIFLQVGVVDAGRFKGIAEIDELKKYVNEDLESYVELMKWHGYYAEGFSSIGTDVVEGVNAIMPKIIKKFPQVTLFGGQLVLPHETFITRLLHNYTVFAVQRTLYARGIPVIILPISSEFGPQMKPAV